MRAEQWFMIAVGGLGVYAIYRLVTTKASDQKSEEIKPAATGPVGPVNGPIPPVTLLQNILGHNAPPGSALLRTGVPYRGRLELPISRPPVLPMPPPPGGFPPFSTLVASASREQITSELQRLGFGDVIVYMTLAEAESGDAIPLPGALVTPTPGSRWFAATWRGPSGVHAFPRELVLLWPTATPRTLMPAASSLQSFAG